jgi:hypothetical protein
MYDSINIGNNIAWNGDTNVKGYQKACYKCPYIFTSYQRKTINFGNGPKSMPTYSEDNNVVDPQALYETICIKNAAGECDPMYSPPSFQ